MRVTLCVSRSSYCLLLFLLMLIGKESVTGQTSGPQFVSIVSTSAGFTFTFTPETQGWVAIEESIDMLEWSTRVRFKSTRDVELHSGALTHGESGRFFRLNTLESGVSDMQEGWDSQNISRYRYDVVRTVDGSLGLRFLGGTVTVIDGEKSVVWNDEFTSDLEPDPEELPTIEDLFNRIRDAENSPQFLRMFVKYDFERHFPHHIHIGRQENEPTTPFDYGRTVVRISNFIFLD